MTRFIGLPLFFLLLLAGSCKQKQPGADDKLPIDVKILEKKDGGGWEYDIYVDHKLYIKQDRIPAVPGIQGFASKEDAEKTSKLVVELIKKGQIPSVSVQDLKSLKVWMPGGTDDRE